MTTMQNHFISRDTSNNWDAGLNTPNPRMAVMAMEDGFTMPSAAFKDSIPMTNYTQYPSRIRSFPSRTHP